MSVASPAVGRFSETEHKNGSVSVFHVIVDDRTLIRVKKVPCLLDSKNRRLSFRINSTGIERENGQIVKCRGNASFGTTRIGAVLEFRPNGWEISHWIGKNAEKGSF